jgi:hypothetical protein
VKFLEGNLGFAINLIGFSFMAWGFEVILIHSSSHKKNQGKLFFFLSGKTLVSNNA